MVQEEVEVEKTCVLWYIQKTDVCSLIEVKILSLIILRQYVFAYLKIPGPSIFGLLAL